jgi:hypothetical protein
MESILNKGKAKIDEIEYNIRKQKSVRDMVYPWNNHDFSLQTLISNNYSPKKLGISDKPLLGTFVNDLTKIPKYPELLVEGPLINKITQAGISDVSPTDKDALAIKQKYKKFKEPYPGFSNEYPEYFPLTGEKSSSYFLKVGYCPVKSKTDKQLCEASGFSWFGDPLELPPLLKSFFPNKGNRREDTNTNPADKSNLSPPGKCYKPRYMFINNQVKPIMGMKGPITNLVNDMEDLNPMELLNILTKGQANNKEMRPLPCVEGFEMSNTLIDKNKIEGIMSKILLLILTIFLYSYIFIK